MCYEYEMGVPKDVNEAFFWYQESAKQKFAKGEYSLGTCYAEGICVKQNLEKTTVYYLKAAKQGVPMKSAPFLLKRAEEYLQEPWNTQDHLKAVDIYKTLAALENLAAQVNLAFCLCYQVGVKQDLEEAGALAEKLLVHKEITPEQTGRLKCIVGTCYEKQRPDLARAAYDEAASSGNPFAQEILKHSTSLIE